MLTFSSPPHPLPPTLPPQLLKGVTISQGGVLPHIPEVLLFRKHQLRKMGPSKPKPPTAGPPSPKLPPPPPVKKPAPKTPTKAPPKVSWGRNRFSHLFETGQSFYLDFIVKCPSSPPHTSSLSPYPPSTLTLLTHHTS